VICSTLDELQPLPDGQRAPADRPWATGGDMTGDTLSTTQNRRAIGWPSRRFREGIQQTVARYLDNPDWVRSVTSRLSPMGATAIPGSGGRRMTIP
jgi:dTDP-D-glucose 4,6-dehydratase